MAGQLHHIVSYEIKQTPDFLRRSLLYPPRQSFDKWTVRARTIKSKLPMFCGIHISVPAWVRSAPILLLRLSFPSRASFGLRMDCCGTHLR